MAGQLGAIGLLTCSAGMMNSPWNIARALFILVSQKTVVPSQAAMTTYVNGDPFEKRRAPPVEASQRVRGDSSSSLAWGTNVPSSCTRPDTPPRVSMGNPCRARL